MKNVKSKSGNFGKAIGAIVLALVFAVGGAAAGWFAHAQNWFGLSASEDPTEEDKITVELNDRIIAGAWGEQVKTAYGTAGAWAHLGVTYGALEKGKAVTFTGVIDDDGNYDQVWYTPLVGFYSGDYGVIFRSDFLVLINAPDGKFNSGGKAGQSGEANAESEIGAIYYAGESWRTAEAKASVSYTVTYEYGTDGVIRVTQGIVMSDGGAHTQTYSVRVEDGKYQTYFYGENCAYTLTSMTVSDIPVQDEPEEPGDNTEQDDQTEQGETA